ncbi:MAG: hypothetical protein K2X34_01685 [Hyphomonadaceae bacterium]|nr:hypothetical protein [Hyphomonadaceae bacterium]
MIKVEYGWLMRQVWLSALMVIALAASGVANAMSYVDCPLLAAAVGQASASSHDCCPDGAPTAPGDQAPAKMTGCFVGQACRTAPAITPSLAPLRIIAPALRTKVALITDPALASRAPDAFWRPPRTS